MAKGVFTAEEYKKMYDWWLKNMDGDSLSFDDAVKGKFVGVDYEADNGMYVTCEVQFDHCENWNESGFGRFRREWCDIEFTDVVDLANIVVYENGLRGAKVVDGAFDYDAFFEATK